MTASHETDVVFELPGPGSRTHWFVRLLAGLMACGAILAAPIICLDGGWHIVLGVFCLWSGFATLLLTLYPSVGFTTTSRNACLVNCAAICLAYAGYSYDRNELERGLRLNEVTRGTLPAHLLSFLSNQSIANYMFPCSDVADLRNQLEVAQCPLIAIISKPILLRGLTCVAFWPISLFELLHQWITKTQVSHAVVIHGIADKKVMIYDPLFGTIHRVKWSQLRTWLTPVFVEADFLAIPKRNAEQQAAPLETPDVSGPQIWNSTF